MKQCLINEENFNEKLLNEILFLILFFKEDGFAFRYPMNVFFSKKLDEELLKIQWEEYNNNSGLVQLYIHSIFCDTRCTYCDCHSLLKVDNDDTKMYKEYLLNSISKYGKIIQKPLNSIYFGGGTFNLWSDEEIKEICNSILEKFTLESEYIWEVEIHPYYLTENTLSILKSFGVTHIMLGIQTISSRVNRLNNRRFDIKKVENAVNDIIKLKFKKVSFDLMYNIPYMTADDLINDLEFVYSIGKKLESHGISINVEINRWDISFKTGFASIFLSKFGKEKFKNICEFYIKNSKKLVKIVDTYIDRRFLGLFDTEREEIEERKMNNTAILGIGLSATSYIPGKIAYEDVSNKVWKTGKTFFKGYGLIDLDKDLFFISSNLRRGINQKLFFSTCEKSIKLKKFYKFYKNKFKFKGDLIFMDVNTDIENDLLNLFLINSNILLETRKKLLKRWEKLGFRNDELLIYSNLFLEYYYNRNKLYG